MGNARNVELNFEALMNAKESETKSQPESEDFQNQL